MAPVEEAPIATTTGSSEVVFQYGGLVNGAKGRGKGVGGDGRRAMKQPRGICLDPSDGALFVADYGNNCVYRFARGDNAGIVVAGEEGYLLPTVDPLKDIDRPVGPPEGEGKLLKRPIDVGRIPEGVLVLDCEECRVQRFSADDRSVVAAVVVPTPGSTAKKSVNTPEALKYPRMMAPQEDGSLIVCDTWSHRVLRFPPVGTQQADGTSGAEVLAGFPNSCGTRPDQLSFPSSVVVTEDGSLLVADTNNHRVQRFPAGCGARGKAETVAGSATCEPGDGLGDLNMPTGLCLDPRDGSLLVADRLNSRVLRFPPGSRAGDAAEVIVGADTVDRPWGVCVDADGTIFVSDERQGKILQLRGDHVQPRPPKPAKVEAPPAPAGAPAALASEPLTVAETDAPESVAAALGDALD